MRLGGIQNTTALAKEEMEKTSSVGKVSDMFSRIKIQNLGFSIQDFIFEF